MLLVFVFISTKPVRQTCIPYFPLFNDSERLREAVCFGSLRIVAALPSVVLSTFTSIRVALLLLTHPSINVNCRGLNKLTVCRVN